MKKLLSVILALALCLSLGAPALAEDSVVVSPQNLAVDGKAANCEKYNINGSNYFKLRDMAMLLMGTPAAFGIDFDAENFTVKVTRGGTYQPVGSELKAGADNSDTCVPSAWKLLVDGKTVEVSTFNIGGSNFYKLRDMGDALGFLVDFDAATNTAIIYTDAAHTVLGDAASPFAENHGWTFAESGEYHPCVTRYLSDSAGVLIDRGITAEFPIIKKSDVRGDGTVTYQITLHSIGSIEFYPPTDMDTTGTVVTNYGLYDYYTGLSFPERSLMATLESSVDGSESDITVVIDGQPYRVSYSRLLRSSGYWERTYHTRIIRNDVTVEIEITAPADYDGLVLAMRCNQNEILFEPYPTDGSGGSSGGFVYRNGQCFWGDDDNLANWVFVRVSDLVS